MMFDTMWADPQEQNGVMRSQAPLPLCPLCL